MLQGLRQRSAPPAPLCRSSPRRAGSRLRARSRVARHRRLPSSASLFAEWPGMVTTHCGGSSRRPFFVGLASDPRSVPVRRAQPRAAYTSFPELQMRPRLAGHCARCLRARADDSAGPRFNLCSLRVGTFSPGLQGARCRLSATPRPRHGGGTGQTPRPKGFRRGVAGCCYPASWRDARSGGVPNAKRVGPHHAMRSLLEELAQFLPLSLPQLFSRIDSICRPAPSRLRLEERESPPFLPTLRGFKSGQFWPRGVVERARAEAAAGEGESGDSLWRRAW